MKDQTTTEIKNYVSAVLLIAAATMLRWALGYLFGVTAPFVTLYPAVILVALLCGRGPAIFAVILGALVTAYAFLEPKGMAVESLGDRIALVTYCFSGFLLVIIAHRLSNAKVKEARRESEVRYRSLFDNMLDGYAHCRIVFDDQGRARDFVYLEVNDVFERVTGLQNVVGRKISEVIPGVQELHPEVFEIYGRVASTGRPERFEVNFKPLETWLSISAYSTKKDQFVAVFEDITERKRLEEALRQSRDELEDRVRERTAEVKHQVELTEQQRDRLATLIDNMHDGVWFADAESRILLANAVARSQAEEVGLDPGAATRYTMASLLSHIELFDQNGNPLEAGYFMRAFRGESLNGVEIGVRNRETGRMFYRRISESPVFGKDGHIEGVIAVVHDITAEKRVAQEKASLEEQLRQSQKMEAIGTLAGGVAHDFNNMLAVILGNAELALDEVGDAKTGVSHNIGQIVKASRRAADLVKQILTFSRRNEGQRRPLDLIPLIEETGRLFRGSLPSTIGIDFDIRTDRATIFADPTQVQQILMNLSMNGAYAMQEDGGTLTIGLSEATFRKKDLTPDEGMTPGRYLVLTVSDTGTGIPREIQPRIFEPFFTTKEAGGGTGMGLAVVFGIVKSYGGAVAVESRPGKGSTFNVYLPAYQGTALEERADVTQLPKGRERVLVIDDEPFVVEMASENLQRLGYRVTTAEGGPEGWKKFNETPQDFDLVITDHVMPHLTGLRLAEKMLTVRKDLPIILFTGYSETVSAEKAKARGVSEFLMKPVSTRDLAETVRRVLDGRDKGP